MQAFVGSGWLGGVVCRTVDGDTAEADREAALSGGNVLLTNPDMLHASLLPNHGHCQRVRPFCPDCRLFSWWTWKRCFGPFLSTLAAQNFTTYSSTPRSQRNLPLSPIQLFRCLRFVVVDEAHMYSGAFGAHTSLVLRRLCRLCEVYTGRLPQFICCSATLSNPGE